MSFFQRTFPLRARSEVIRPSSVTRKRRPFHHAGEAALRLPIRRRHLTLPLRASSATAVPLFVTKKRVFFARTGGNSSRLSARWRHTFVNGGSSFAGKCLL